MVTNLLMGRWSSQGVNLWGVDLQTVPLVQGQATYSIPANTVTILDLYMTVTSGGVPTNRYLLPISRTEYASYPNITQQGYPTVYWYDRLLNGSVTFYYVPDGTQTSFSYYRLRQNMDANFTDGQTLELPQYFYDALAFGMAFRIALVWNPEKATMLKPLADEAYDIAATQNIESSDFFISPMIGSYYRN